MACDEALVIRLREQLSEIPGVGERRMFGGVCFTLNGNMLCGVVKNEIMVRVGEDAYPAALRSPHAREMDFTGRPMRGYVFVGARGIGTSASLRKWIEAARDFVENLPNKVVETSTKSKFPRRTK